MNYLLIPDLAAMAMLLGILYFLRRRHPDETVDFWLVALVFIFLEAIIHAAYPSPGRWRLVAHVVGCRKSTTLRNERFTAHPMSPPVWKIILSMVE